MYHEKTNASIARVDRTAGVLRGVKLLGRTSKNGREYTSDAMREARGLYENKKVFVGHPEKPGDRTFSDWVGEVRNVQLRSDGLYGDVRLRQKSQHYESILEAAEEFPEALGMSHVADGEGTIRDDGTEIVEAITAVFSVDLVLEPATCAGLFESKSGSSLSAQVNALGKAVRKVRSTEGDQRQEALASMWAAVDAIGGGDGPPKNHGMPPGPPTGDGCNAAFAESNGKWSHYFRA